MSAPIHLPISVSWSCIIGTEPIILPKSKLASSCYDLTLQFTDEIMLLGHHNLLFYFR